MRRVAAGEASQFDGILHKGLPLRVLSKSDLLLKDSARVGDDIPDELAEVAQQNPDHEWFKQPEEEGEESEGEGTLSEEQLDTIWDELSEAKQMLLEDPRYGHIGEKLGEVMEELTAAMYREQQGGGSDD